MTVEEFGGNSLPRSRPLWSSAPGKGGWFVTTQLAEKETVFFFCHFPFYLGMFQTVVAAVC